MRIPIPKISSKSMLLMALLPFALMSAAFQLSPLVAMMMSSLSASDGSGFTWSQYIQAFQNPYYLRGILNSLNISIVTASIAVSAAIVCSYSLTKLTGAARDKWLTIVNMTSNFEGVPLAFSYILLLGNNGMLTLLFNRIGWDVFSSFDLYSWTGLILVYVYFQIPLAILLLYPAMHGLQPEWREAAALLGARRWRYWMKIGIPVLMPSIAGTFSILIANAMGAYATAYALVGSNYNLLSLQIASLVASDVVLNRELGSALGLLLASSMLAAMWLNERMLRRVRRDLR